MQYSLDEGVTIPEDRSKDKIKEICAGVSSVWSIYLSARQSVHPSIHLPTYLLAYLSIYLSIHPSIFLSVHPSIHASVYKTLKYVTAPRQLQIVLANAAEGATWRLYSRSWVQGEKAKQVATEIVYDSATEQCRPHQRARRLYGNLEMVLTVSEYTTSSTSLPHICILTWKIVQNMDNLYVLSILPKQQQNGLKTDQTKGVCPN
jgi:hypothetical protein